MLLPDPRNTDKSPATTNTFLSQSQGKQWPKRTQGMACHRARGHQQQQSLLSFTFLSCRGMSGFTANHIPTLWILFSLFSVLSRYLLYVIKCWLFLCQCFWSIQNFQFVLLPRLSDANICQVSSKWIRYPFTSGYDTLGLHLSSTTAQPNVCKARRFQEVRSWG